MIKGTIWTMNTDTSIRTTAVVATEYANALTFQRIMGRQELHYSKLDSGQHTYTINVNSFMLSWNPLARFSIHFPYFEGVPVEQAQLEAAIVAIVSVSKSIFFATPEYTTAIARFCVVANGELPTPVFVYDYPYIYLRPYLLHYFGKPTINPKYTMSERDEITGVWLKRFVNRHFMRIGLLAQQYGHVMELP